MDSDKQQESDSRLLILAKSVLAGSVEFALEGQEPADGAPDEVLSASGILETGAPSNDPILALKKSRELLRMAGVAVQELEAGPDRDEFLSELRAGEARRVVVLHDLGHADVISAVELFEAVLSYRSFERDPDAWAYAMLELGGAKARQATAASGRPSLAGVETYKDSIRGFQSAGNSAAEATALFTAGSDMCSYLESTDLAQEFETLVEAIALATRALELKRAGSDTMGLADCLALMCVLADLAEQEPAEFAAEALMKATPQDCSELVLKAASILGSIRFDDQDWRSSGEALQFAADGYLHRAVHTVQPSGDAPDNVGDLLCQWAAYAWIRAGHLEQAIEATEMGANRDLSLLIRHHELLEYVQSVTEQDPVLGDVLAEELKLFRNRLLEGPAGSGSLDAESPPRWNTFLAEIRDRFHIDPPVSEFDLDEFAVNLNNREALCVINTSPAGTAGVVISVASGEPRLSAVHSASLTADSVADLVLVGVDEPSLADDEFVVEHAWNVGEVAGEFLSELRAVLLERQIEKLVLVPTGQNALLPWHCAPFGDGVQLINDFEISYSPSASIFSECRRRTQGRSIETAVVIADPIPHVVPLTPTRREADLLQSTASTIWFDLRVGHEATTGNFSEQFPLYDVVHLAVHGRSLHMDGRPTSGISLADDRELGWTAIARVSSDLAPLVVLSACQGGLVQAYGNLARQFSLPEAFLVAGASGVIARLWPVDDDATTILMTRFYTLLAENPGDPRGCLREAQLWLRSATVKDIGSLVGRSKGLKRAATTRSRYVGGDAPYADIDLWASFVYVGA